MLLNYRLCGDRRTFRDRVIGFSWRPANIVPLPTIVRSERARAHADD